MSFSRLPSYKGASQWYSRDDYFYIACRTRGDSTSMRCSSTGCPAKWILRGEVAGPVTGNHDHQPTPWIPNRNAMFQALKRRATNETIGLNAIYEEEAARYPDAASHLLWDSVAPSMRAWRRATTPAVPASLAEYAAALAEHPRHSGMLLATVSAGGATAVILAQDGFSQCLRDSNTIVVDATFLTVPAGVPAAQLLTIHAIISGFNFHPILVLMENRRRPLYEAVLSRVWQAAGNPQPQHIVTDFETGLQMALESVTGVQVQGCLFHFVQALLRQARSCGIPVGRNSPGWQLVQLYATLALLPAAQMRLGLAELPAIVEARGLPINQAFQDYFESQWMIRVGPERLSVHGSPHQTSNVAESFHASLRLALGASPNIWRFTDIAAQKFSVSASRLEAQARGELPRRNRERLYARRNVHAGNQRALERGLITLREFVDSTSRLLDVGSGIVVDNVPEVAVEIEIAPEPEVARQEPLRVPELPRGLPVGIVPPRQVENDFDNDFPEIDIAVALRPEVVLDIQEPLQLPAQPRPAQPAPVLCSICMENALGFVLIPCGHALCALCLDRVISCPFCRAAIRTRQPLYLS